MSRMIPPYCSPDIKSTAERLIFDLLKHDPETENWICLHSLGLARHVKRLQGEIDFVVFIPGEGVFCLEVKGGSVARREGIWIYTNRLGRQETSVVGPFRQAQDGMFSLLETLRQRVGTNQRLTRLAFGYGVVFPHVAFDKQDSEWEDWSIYDRDSRRLPVSAYLQKLAQKTHAKLLAQLEAKTRLGHRFWYDPVASRPTAADVTELLRLLRCDFELVAGPRDLEDDTEQRLNTLTSEQYQALDMLEVNSCCIFDGGAGTGKTFLAREHARRMAAESHRVLLICFNKLLGQWLQTQNRLEGLEGRVTARSFHVYLDDLIYHDVTHREEFRLLRDQRLADLFDQKYPLYALLALDQGACEPFDVLIVDEAQDLIRAEYLDVMNSLVKGGLAGGRWVMFCDFHRQAIYAQLAADQMLELLDQRVKRFARYPLKINCRNTRPIGEETSMVSGFQTPPFRLNDVAGRPVDYRFYDNDAQQRDLLEQIVQAQIADGIAPGKLTLLSPVTRVNSCLAGVVHLGGCTVHDLANGVAVSKRNRTILEHTTIHAFKGLENNVVILHDIGQIADDRSRSLLYIGMSCARERLFVLLSSRCKEEYYQTVKQRVERGLAR